MKVRIDSIQLDTIVTLVTDIVLLLIMLVGVFRLRRDGGGAMALGRLFWNQVGWCNVLLNQSVDFDFVRVLSGSSLLLSPRSRRR